MSIYIYPFTPSDIPDLHSMHNSQGQVLTPIHVETLPKTGFIVKDHTNTPIAAGFLRLVEGGTAQLDTLVTNASISGQTRNDALDLLVQTLISTAKSMNILGLMCTSNVESILSRSKKFGFTKTDLSVIILPLI